MSSINESINDEDTGSEENINNLNDDQSNNGSIRIDDVEQNECETPKITELPKQRRDEGDVEKSLMTEFVSPRRHDEERTNKTLNNLLTTSQ